jgi:hypothetical protein
MLARPTTPIATPQNGWIVHLDDRARVLVLYLLIACATIHVASLFFVSFVISADPNLWHYSSMHSHTLLYVFSAYCYAKLVPIS